MNKILNKIKDYGMKILNIGFAPLDRTVKKLNRWVRNPVTGVVYQLHVHNSKYLPDGTVVVPGTPIK